VPNNTISSSLRWIAHGSRPDVATYCGYVVNGIRYHTKKRDDIRNVQNSGVMLIANTLQVSNVKDKNPIMSDMTFYGVIQEIWELSYRSMCPHNHFSHM
jgi:hypothetical protein